jgi:hypothetical protein
MASEEMDIEEYWGLFKDTLPGAESTVEVIYRVLEVLTRQVHEFSNYDERGDHYPELITKRIRNPESWSITLKYWNHTEGESKIVVGVGQIYSIAVYNMLERITDELKRESALRLGWVKETERKLAKLKLNYHITENLLTLWAPTSRSSQISLSPRRNEVG